MLVLKRRELRLVQASARVVPPTLISRVWSGLATPMPTRPPVGARRMRPGRGPTRGCSEIEAPLPATKGHLVVAGMQLARVRPVSTILASRPAGADPADRP